MQFPSTRKPDKHQNARRPECMHVLEVITSGKRDGDNAAWGVKTHRDTLVHWSTAPGLPLGRLRLGLVLLAHEAGREAEPAAPLVAVPEAEAAGAVAEGGLDGRERTLAAGGVGAQQRGLGLALVALLDQLAGDDAEDLLDALAVLGADLVAAVPADVQPPEAAAALAVGALQAAAQQRGGGRGRRRLRRVQLLGDVGDGALEGHAAARWVEGDDVRLGADDVDDDGLILAQVPLQLEQPAGHLVEAALVGDVVAEQAGVGAAVVEAGDAAEALLAGRVPYLQADDGVGGRVEDAFGDEGRADGGRDVCGVEGVLDVALHEGGLSDAWEVRKKRRNTDIRRRRRTLGAEDDDLGLERGAHGLGVGLDGRQRRRERGEQQGLDVHDPTGRRPVK